MDLRQFAETLGVSYFLRIASSVSLRGPGAVGSYGVYAGTDMGPLVSAGMAPAAGGAFDRPEHASSLPVDTVQTYHVSSGDEERVPFTAPFSLNNPLIR